MGARQKVRGKGEEGVQRRGPEDGQLKCGRGNEHMWGISRVQGSVKMVFCKPSQKPIQNPEAETLNLI